ncbi:uncharacterized protein LOC132725897 [Ruditapes philippinarum]|uniref:uncharacterized protein LOC132725897 n=1 Tax=Ruditapes philippinarum TaxID=129788 RepID=UPI00295BF773|nr:uncharacterized protein LOC132725897 [Ruditapes philippinarum]
MADSGSKIGEDDEVPGRVKEYLCQPYLSKDKETVADKFCSTCNEFQCNDCSNVHNVLAILKSHKLVSVNEADVASISVKMKALDLCDQHQHSFEFFCEDEKKLCCSKCAIVNHRKCHSVVEIEKIAGKITSPSSILGEKLKEAKEAAESVARHIRSSKDQLAEDIKEIHVQVRRMRDEVMRMFDDIEDFVAKKAETLQRETLQNLTMKQTQNEKHLADVTSCLETIESIFKNGTPAQKYIAEQKMESNVNALCRISKEECQNVKVNISFQFDETFKLPPLPITEYVPGQFQFKSDLEEDVNSAKMAMKLTPVSSIDLKKTGDDIDEPFYTGIDFLPDGRLVAVDNKNMKCFVYNEKLEKVGSFQLSYNPVSVVVVSEEEVAITCGYGYKIEFLHVSKCNEITPQRTCKVNTKYFSICLKDDRQFVVGTIDEPIPVRIVSLTGEELDFSVNFPNKIYPIDTSDCTYIKSSDKVVITDRYEHTVCIYDIKTDTRVVVKDDKIQEPRGAAVGPSDTILLCCRKTNTIVQISQRGQVLSSYKIDMENPFKVCVSRDKSFLVVTNSYIGNRKMQKFKIST